MSSKKGDLSDFTKGFNSVWSSLGVWTGVEDFRGGEDLTENDLNRNHKQYVILCHSLQHSSSGYF